jgi:hypothetical protein
MYFVAILNVDLNMEGYIFTKKKTEGGGMKGSMYWGKCLCFVRFLLLFFYIYKF